MCDTFAALTSDRPYRKAFDSESAVELMIEESKNFDMLVFLAFLRVIHRKDFEEMEIRDYVIRMIKDTYGSFGFSSIETPCVEHIENLSSKQGGENEKLIFKILKRGEKLKLDTAGSEADLVDGGLRYDLTVPLSRYYANNANDLPSPF